MRGVTCTVQIAAILRCLSVAALLSVLVPLVAQENATAPFGALPGDTPLPTVDFQLQVSMGPAAGTPPEKKPVRVTAGLTYELALEAAQTAIAVCRADGYPVGVAVSDENGQMRVGLADDGVSAARIYTAARKNLAAELFRVPSSQLRLLFEKNPALRNTLTPSMSAFPGAIPILIGDRVVGAIGTSGAFGNEEEKCARAGLLKIQARLK